MPKKNELALKCNCIPSCGIVTFESLDYLNMKGEIAIEFYQKKRVRGNAITINEEQTRELINFLNKQLDIGKNEVDIKEPKDIIDRDFKNGCLVYKNVNHLGIYHPVLVKIDYSEGDPEIEFQGREAPTRKLQDIKQMYEEYHKLEEKGCFYCLLCKFYDKDKDYCSHRKEQPERYYHCPHAKYTDLTWYIILRGQLNILKEKLETDK